MRTTASVESMNAVFGVKFPMRSNIYNFIDNLRQFDYSVVDSMNDLVDCVGKVKLKREQNRNRDEKIEYLSQMLDHNNISIGEFLNKMAKDEDEEQSEKATVVVTAKKVFMTMLIFSKYIAKRL